ncbi:phage tail spike protein [Lactiplantibacillus plantarum]|uniref:phage tail spike protein n=1 Tax=Lactiplantibacillus plantarum TaxID=1590 RepID=UPI00155A5595|nr:phage tail spike protein [Lactiplantibacillus plantarum]
MALNNQYLILNSNLRRIGTLTVDGATKFSNDSIKIQLADSDTTSTSYDDDVNVGTTDSYTGTINLNAQSKKFDHQGSLDVLQGQPDSDKVVAGNNLAYYDSLSGHWYVMRIYSVEENNTAAVKHVTTANFTNLCLYTLAKHYPIATKSVASTIKTAFDECFNATGWTLDYQTTNVMTPSITIDGKTKASTLLQTLIQTYNVEIDPYVEIDSQGNITKKVCVITDQLNNDVVYNEAVFGKNMTSIKRTTVSTPVTKLIPYGANGRTIASANDGKIYIVDDNANEKYNPDWQAGLYYEGVVTANSIEDPGGIKAWAEEMLKLYNHPRTYYEVNVTPNFNPPLGATIRFKDELIKPVLDASGRVIQRTISFANPYGNTVGFGEYTTVQVATPAWLTDYQSALEDAVSKALSDATAITPVLSHPDGLDFAQGETSKRLLLSAWVGKQNISTYVDSKGFAWRHVNTDGSIDSNWEQTGDLINVTPSLMGNIRAYIDGDYISEDPELSINQSNYVKIGEFDPYDSDVHHIAQHLEQLDDGTWYESAATSGDDCNFMHRDKDFKLIDKMVLTGGGHGTTFGVMYQDGQPWIMCNQRNSAGNWDIVRFKYQGGKTLGINDTDHLITPGGYPRVVFDREHNVAGYSSGGFMFFVLNVSDLLIGVKTVMYSINMLDYSFIGNDIFQGQALDFPYVYWSVGNQYLGKTCSFYCVNLLHRGEVIHPYYDTLIGLGLSNQIIEPESLSFATINGKKTLIHSFNVTPPDGNPPKKQMQYSTDIIYRPAMPVVNNDNNGSNDGDDD